MGNSETPQSRLTRRTVLKGAAWSAPVVAVAIAAPAAAASILSTYVISGFAGWSTNPDFILEAYVKVRATNEIVPDVEVTWTFDTGQVKTAITNTFDGFARLNLTAADIDGDPSYAIITYADASINQPVIGDRPQG